MCQTRRLARTKFISRLDSAEALAGLAQMGVLEVHPWGSRNEDLERPDRLIFDLDPDESLPWSTVTEAAAEVRARLKKIGLTSFLKTTGGKGLHVVIPVDPALEWPAAKDFAHKFVIAMERQKPTALPDQDDESGTRRKNLSGLSEERTRCDGRRSVLTASQRRSARFNAPGLVGTRCVEQACLPSRQLRRMALTTLEGPVEGDTYH